MSILVELRASIAETLRRARAVRAAQPWVLWLDAEREWEQLLDRVGKDWEILRYQGSQVEMRARLERERPERPRIVYVPLDRAHLTVLKEYEFLVPVFDKPLLGALREWGVEVDPEDEKSLRPLLPTLVDRWADRPLTFWRDLSKHRVLERLFEDAQVRAFLAEPGATAAELQREGLLGVFEDFLELRFGMRLHLQRHPEGAATLFVQGLLLAEARTAAPAAPGFPHPDRLPVESAREACIRFLREWLQGRDQSEVAVRRILAADGSLHLGPWAAGLPGFVETEGSLGIEQALLARTLAEVKEQPDRTAREAYLRDRAEPFSRRSGHFWTWAGGPEETAGRVPEWKALAGAAELIAIGRSTLERMIGAPSLDAIAEAYAAEGYRVDLLYRRFRASFESLGGLEEVRATVKGLHREWQEAVTKRFTALLESAGGLATIPFEDQTRVWTALLDEKKRTAVLVLDAFRFELGRSLEALIHRWGGPVACEVRPMLAPLPSITPIGMARLVAGRDVEVIIDDGRWLILPTGEASKELDLATKEGRRRVIQQRSARTALLELRQLQDLPAAKVPKEKLAIVFSGELDDAGHSGVLSLTPGHAEEYVRHVAAAVRRLAAAGYEVVHVVTDHGFFLLDEVGEEDIIPCAADGVRYKSHRAILAERIETPTLIRLPFGAGDLTLGLPHGVGLLQARGPYEFFHGGASLQELIIPWVTVRFPSKARQFSLQVAMAPRITSRLFDVTLTAVEPGGQKELLEDQLRARYADLKLFRLEGGKPAGDPLATASGPECFVGAQQRQTVVRMRVATGARFSYGDQVRLSALDADAPGVELDHKDGTINVEPEP
jgi:hypothetical protein